MRKTILSVVLVCCLLLVVAAQGCTPGQALTPANVKQATANAYVDAQYTSTQVRQAAATQPADPLREEALRALDRIVVDLDPVDRWMTGRK